MPSAYEFIEEGKRHIGAKYSTARRTWSADVERPESFDCSGYILYLARRMGIPEFGSVSNAQMAGTSRISVDQARMTPGALLFKVGVGPAGHVAISLGNGDTLETYGRGGTAIVKGGANRSYFTVAGLIPGLDYANQGYDPAVLPDSITATENKKTPESTAELLGTRLTADQGGVDPGDGAVISVPEQEKPKAPEDPFDSGQATDEEILASEEAAAANATTGAGPQSRLPRWLRRAAPGPAPGPAGAALRRAAPQGDWATDLLKALGMPATNENKRFMNAWKQAEGTAARNNPLATTQGWAGSSNFNRVGVKNYATYQDGLAATVKTLTNGRYGQILNALRAGNNAMAAADAVAASPWGTGRGVRRVLGGR